MDNDGSAWRSPALAAAVESIEAELGLAWTALLGEMGVEPGTPEESALAQLVADHPADQDWRTVDAALDHLTCPDCGATLTRGPAACPACSYYHGMRFGARETDRPGVPAGNEHAIRVACAVTRARARYSPRARAGYELMLPDLMAGALPSTRQAQAAKALINKLTSDECDRVTTIADVEELASNR